MFRPSVVALAPALVLVLAALAMGQGREPIYDETKDKVTSKEPPFALTRPNKEWVFVDLDKAKKLFAKAKGEHAAEEAYKIVKARLYHGGHPADFYVCAWEDARDDASSAKAGEEQLASAKALLKEAKVTASGATTVGKVKAWAFELEGNGPDGKGLALSKVVAWREADKQLFVLSLECPRDRAKVARKDLAKLLKGIQLQ